MVIGGWAPGLHHPFFNTEAVVDNLRVLKVNAGRVRVDAGHRDPVTGLVNGWLLAEPTSVDTTSRKSVPDLRQFSNSSKVNVVA